MDKFVNYKDAPFGDRIGWSVEYEPVWGGEGIVMGWKQKIMVPTCDRRGNVVFAGLKPNYELKIDKDDFVCINGNKYNAFDCLKPVENRGLYDLCIDNHIDIPDSIPKDRPCYKQFMKEKEAVK